MWGRLVLESLVRPRSAARKILALGLPIEVGLQAAVAVTSIGVVLGYLALHWSGVPADPISQAVLGNPLVGAMVQLGLMLVIAVLTYRIGRALGGSGSLPATLSLIVWLNAVLVAVQAGQLVLLMLVPAFASLLAIVALAWLVWAFTAFVTELHQFRYGLVVLAGVALALVVIFAVIAILLALIGVTPQGPA